MCAVIGIQSKNYIDTEIFKNLLTQSMIRGKHATGIAWIENDTLKTHIIPKSADFFDLPEIKTKTIIGHCRYSTSDLQFNQPIFSKDFAVVHNGVITQTNPETWEKTYNFKFQTKCDSEIILRYWENNTHALSLQGSMAALVIDKRKKDTLHFFRNEQRPLYYTKTEKTFYIASTKNILERSGINNAQKADCCVDYKLENCVLKKTKIRDIFEDLQK